MSAGEIIRPPHYGEGPETRTEAGEAGPSYEDYPTGEDVGFTGTPPETPEWEAVEVAIVSMPKPAQRRTTWRPTNAFVDGTRPTHLSGASMNRNRLVVKNTNAAGGASVFLVPDATTPPNFGYELQAQDTLELFHNEDVWAVCLATFTATVSYAAEFDAE